MRTNKAVLLFAPIVQRLQSRSYDADEQGGVAVCSHWQVELNLFTQSAYVSASSHVLSLHLPLSCHLHPVSCSQAASVVSAEQGEHWVSPSILTAPFRL